MPCQNRCLSINISRVAEKENYCLLRYTGNMENVSFSGLQTWPTGWSRNIEENTKLTHRIRIREKQLCSRLDIEEERERKMNCEHEKHKGMGKL